jgi:hypothetical protein
VNTDGSNLEPDTDVGPVDLWMHSLFSALVADAANYKIKIKEMALYVRKVQLSLAVRMGHVKALGKTSCKYTVRRVEVKVDTVPLVQCLFIKFM